MIAAPTSSSTLANSSTSAWACSVSTLTLLLSLEFKRAIIVEIDAGSLAIENLISIKEAEINFR